MVSAIVSLSLCRLDVSNTGFISVSDLKVVMGEEYPEETIRKMMSVRPLSIVVDTCVNA